MSKEEDLLEQILAALQALLNGQQQVLAYLASIAVKKGP